MFIPNDDDVIDSRDGAKAGESQTDRTRGEYHYKNGYTQKIYSDAHYIREEENTVPPRYYTPPERPVREPRGDKGSSSGRAGALAKTICLCLVCAMLGGFGGAALVGSRMEQRIYAMEQNLSALQEESMEHGVLAKSISEGGRLSAAAIYELACPQVVGINTETAAPANILGIKSPSVVNGTGFIVSENGYIVTNHHVVEKACSEGGSITVILHDGSRHSAGLIGAEHGNDIAVLKIDAGNLSPAAFGSSGSLVVGQDVFAVGNPLGELEFSMSTGRVSALDRSIRTDEGAEPIKMFQIDAAVNTGNSGGPLYNDRGEVVGVVTAKYSDSGVEGIGFAIPIDDVAVIVNDLITVGYVTGKAYLGVSLDSRYNSVFSRYYGMPMGAYVYSVDPGSCAEKAGLRPGDIITALGDMPVEGYEDLRSAVRCFSAGDECHIQLYREGETLGLDIIFDEQTPDSNSDCPVKIQPAD